MMDSIGPRWKRKGFATIAQDNPLSKVLERLQVSLKEYNPPAFICGCDVIIEAQLDLADLLHRACFGQTIATYEKDKQSFQLGPEEAFYLSHALKCLLVFAADGSPLNGQQLWMYFKANVSKFPYHYKAYAHLRAKNWVVRPGLQYGATYVAYRHHPALIHSEYAVLVEAEDSLDADFYRLKDWADWQCALRVSGGVAKNLLVLTIIKNNSTTTSLSCLEEYTVEERIIRRWVPESTRESNSTENEILDKECSSAGPASFHIPEP